MELTHKRYVRRDLRQALGTRRGTVALGLVCAALAAVVLLVAAAAYRRSVQASANAATVLVATQRIPKNTSGTVIATETLFKATRIAAAQVTAGAVADAGALRAKVAVRDIFPGEQLTAADFTGNGGLPAQLAPDHRAVTLSLDSQHGMVGLLHNGDHVDVYAGVDDQSNLGRSAPVLRLLIRDVPVLRAGSTSSGSSGISSVGSGSGTSDVTLDVNDGAAGALAFAQDHGKVWLVLRPANAVNTVAPSLITVQSFLLATQPVSPGGGK
jgi:pilus assembly protein CpaB